MSLNHGIVFASTSNTVATERYTAMDDAVLSDIEAQAEKLGPQRITAMIQKGDTASSILSDYLPYSEIITLADSCDNVFSLSCLRVGKPYTIVMEGDQFKAFEYEIDNENRLVVTREDDGFQAKNEKLEFEYKTHLVEGAINSSLFKSLVDIGETPELAIRLAEIFAWEIDFIRDIRKEDSFRVLVEKRYRDGKDMGYGRIFAAQFTNRGKRYEGYLFEDSDGQKGYYNADGANLQKAFLKAPLSFRRISSGFNMKRKHPILHVVRPHPAIDYAAATGTPVMAIGDGTVIAKTYGRGPGNYVKIRHPNGYESTYMHLSGFAKGLSKGQKVSQSDVIGYVGSTGLSTGPHLDFRMKRHGQWVNPNKIENVRAESITKEKMDTFRQIVARHHAAMAGQLAAVDHVQSGPEVLQ